MPRVLIADPDAPLLATYEEHLYRDGFEVATVRDGLECVRHLREFAPDLLVLEPVLPWGWGEGVLAVMRDGDDVPPVPVLILTTNPDRSFRSWVAAFPIVRGCCHKPLTPGQLGERIRAVLADAGPGLN